MRDNLGKRFGIGADIGFVVDFLGIGADHQIAVESGGNQNSFALSGGDLKDHRLDQMILVFVQDYILAAPRRNLILIDADHGSDPVAEDSGAVDHELCPQAAPTGFQMKISGKRLDGQHFLLQSQVNTVGERVFRQRDGKLIGRSDTGILTE